MPFNLAAGLSGENGGVAESRARYGLRQRFTFELSDDDWTRIEDLAREQSARYGHDTGYFSLGREESSHLYGCVGEVALVRYLQLKFDLREHSDVGLYPPGATFDVWFRLSDRRYGVHVKTGVWRRWPTDDTTFGIHAGQRVPLLGAPLVLVSVLRDKLRHVRVEGVLSARALSEAPVLAAGQLFPGSRYTSRTENLLTRVGDYAEIASLSQLSS